MDTVIMTAKRIAKPRVVRARKAEFLHATATVEPVNEVPIKNDKKKDHSRTKPYQRAKKTSENPLQADFDIKDLGGVSRIEREAEILQLDWAIRFPLMKPYEYLTIEKNYSVNQANAVLHESGGTTDWEMRRVEIQNKVTETVVKRHVDQIADFNDTFIKGSKVGMAKALEMLSKFSIEAVRDEDGKLMIDPKTKKPIYRGFRSIDLLNTLNALKIAQEIWRKGLGITDGEGGMAQVLEQVTQLTELQKREVTVNQTNINLTMNPVRQEAQQKLEQFVGKLSYDDIRTFIDYHKDKKKKQIVEAEVRDET